MWKSFLVLVCCALGSGPAGAVSFEARNFDALAREADQVVIGTMADKSSRRTGEREIVTDYRFDNLKVVKGTVPGGTVPGRTVPGNTLTLTMLGGTVGTESLMIAGAPTFNRGTRYLIFVSGNGSVMFPLVGGFQGIFQMRKDAVTGVTRVHDHAGRPLKRLPGIAGKNVELNASLDADEGISEDAFVEAIRSSSSKSARANAGGAK